MRTRSSRSREQALFHPVQGFPSGLGQCRVGTDNLANHLPRRQIERSLRSRTHRQRHRTLRTKTDSLRRRLLPWPHSGRLGEHEDGNGFLSGFKFPVTAQTIQMIHVRPRPVKIPSRYSLQPAARGTSMQKDSRRPANQACSSQKPTASRTLLPMGAGSAARVSRSKTPRQQVAAVCYRIRGSRLEFLLVQTSGGRWIFPKGGVEPGHTHAESAALEAFEEAGVHGRMEKIAFTRYYRRKPVQSPEAKDENQLSPCTSAKSRVSSVRRKRIAARAGFLPIKPSNACAKIAPLNWELNCSASSTKLPPAFNGCIVQAPSQRTHRSILCKGSASRHTKTRVSTKDFDKRARPLFSPSSATAVERRRDRGRTTRPQHNLD